MRSNNLFAPRLICSALAAAFPPLVLGQLPAGAQVVSGAQAPVLTAANRMQVTQTAQRAIINWQNFSIGANQYVIFAQPGTSAVVLNRVVGGMRSDIFGSLSANGQVFIVNPQGVYFGAGASLDVGGLLATTLAISNENFLAGNYAFTRDPAAPSRASIENYGRIAARAGGYVVLAGDAVTNGGMIQAHLGTVALAAGSRLALDIAGDRLVSFAVNEKTLANAAGVANTGQLLADGGRIFMTAKTAGDLAATVVNADGLLQARSVYEQDGAIVLSAEGGSVQVKGTLDASALPGAHGGAVDARSTGGNVVLANGASIKVSGNDIGVSNAGRVYTWADGFTRFEKDARIQARGGAQGGDGGFVEISGRQVQYRGLADLRAPKGRMGTVRVDPDTVTIRNGSGSDSSATFYEENLESQLRLSNVTVTASGGSNATITMEPLADGVLDGRNGSGSGGALTLEALGGGGGTAKVEFRQLTDSIKVGGDLSIFVRGGASGENHVNVGGLQGRNVYIGASGTGSAVSAPVSGTISVGAVTALNTFGSARIEMAATGLITLRGDVTATASSGSPAFIRIQSLGSDSDGAGASIVQNAGTLIKAEGRGADIAIYTGSDASNIPAAGSITLRNVQAIAHGNSSSGRATVTVTGGTLDVGGISALGQGRSSSGAAWVNLNARHSITVAGDVTATNTNSSSGAQAFIRIQSAGTDGDGASASIVQNAATLIKAEGRRADVEIYTGSSVSSIPAAGNITLRNVQAIAHGSSSNDRATVKVTGGTLDVGGISARGNNSNSSSGAWVNLNARQSITIAGDVTATNTNTSSGVALVTIKALGTNGSASDANITQTGGTIKAEGAKTRVAIGTGGSGSAAGNDWNPDVADHGGTVNLTDVQSIGVLRAEIRLTGGTITVAGIDAQAASSSSAQVDIRARTSIVVAGNVRALSSSSQASVLLEARGSDDAGLGASITQTGGAISAEGRSADIAIYTGSNVSSIPAAGSVTLRDVQAIANPNNATVQVTGSSLDVGTISAQASSGNASVELRARASATTTSSLIRASLLTLIMPDGTGTADLTTNVQNLNAIGGSSIIVRNGAQAGTLSAMLGSSGNEVAAAKVETGGALNLTQHYGTGNLTLTAAGPIDLGAGGGTFLNGGANLYFRTNTLLASAGSFTTAGNEAVQLMPYTLTGVLGVHSATDTDATILTNYSGSLLNFFGAGATITFGGSTIDAALPFTGAIHVGADGAANLGAKSVVYATSGNIVVHSQVVTLGTIQTLQPVVVPPPAPPPSSAPSAEALARQAKIDEAGQLSQAIVSGLDGEDSLGGGNAAEDNDAARDIRSDSGIGHSLDPPGTLRPLFELRE